MNNEQKITKELSIIDSLLQDEHYAEEMAKELDAAYYKGMDEMPQPFLTPEEGTLMIEKDVKEEKLATSIAGFYALECGVGYLCDNSELTPLQLSKKIISKQADDATILILNRFANATWKAGQPFRGIERIKKSNFLSANSLSLEQAFNDVYKPLDAFEIKKVGWTGRCLRQINTLISILSKERFV